MTEDRLLEIIAEYLADRDDIADATITESDDRFIHVTTQGGTVYHVSVEETVGVE